MKDHKNIAIGIAPSVSPKNSGLNERFAPHSSTPC
jgi:hypothetical protein